MELSEQVVSPEVAKKLVLPEGWESAFYWIHVDDKSRWSLTDHNNAHYVHQGLKTAWIDEEDTHPAPMLTEMLDMLPNYIMVDKKQYFYKLTPTSIYYSHTSGKIKRINNILERSVFYYKSRTNYVKIPPNALVKRTLHSRATAAALLYMWLCENGRVGGK